MSYMAKPAMYAGMALAVTIALVYASIKIADKLVEQSGTNSQILWFALFITSSVTGLYVISVLMNL